MSLKLCIYLQFGIFHTLSHFIDNEGSCLLLRSSLIVAEDELFVTLNKAEKGAGIKVLDSSLVRFSVQLLFIMSPAPAPPSPPLSVG